MRPLPSGRASVHFADGFSYQSESPGVGVGTASAARTKPALVNSAPSAKRRRGFMARERSAVGERRRESIHGPPEPVPDGAKRKRFHLEVISKLGLQGCRSPASRSGTNAITMAARRRAPALQVGTPFGWKGGTIRFQAASPFRFPTQNSKTKTQNHRG